MNQEAAWPANWCLLDFVRSSLIVNFVLSLLHLCERCNKPGMSRIVWGRLSLLPESRRQMLRRKCPGLSRNDLHGVRLVYNPSMKERYFTPENLSSTADSMVERLHPEGQRRAKEFIPNRAALLMLDLQQYFLEPSSHAFVPSGPVILPIIVDLAESFSTNNRPVIYSKHINSPDAAGSLKGWWRDLITEDHPHQSLHPALDLTAGEILIKEQYDAFYETNLENTLRTNDVNQVLVAGVMTHLCCETTARAAFVRGFEVFFLVDGTATYQRDFHIATLRNLGHGFATLVTSDQIQLAFEAG